MIYEAIDYWSTPLLEHHGVKGMKWGVRKARKYASSYLKKGAKGVKQTALTVSDYPKKQRQRRYNTSDYGRAKKMSNQELQQAINRINLEQSYISAMERDRAAYKEATSNILMKTGRRTVRSLYNKFINSGSAAVDIGSGLIRNAVINSANKTFPITKKPKK